MGAPRDREVRLALAATLALALLLPGCASFRDPVATLGAPDGIKAGESVAIRFVLTNAMEEEMLRAHSSQFILKGGVGFFTCTNQAAGWRLVDVEPGRRVVDGMTLAPGETLWAYLEFRLCPDVAGPYELTWKGDKNGATASDGVPMRTIAWDTDASAAPFDLITRLARDWGEEDRLIS